MNEGYRKVLAGLGLFGIAAPLYLIPNHFPVFPPFELPLTSWDEHTPFIPQTIWIYLSEYPFLISAYLTMKDGRTLSHYVRSMLLILVLSTILFVAFPTSYPRHLFPLPDSLDPLSRFLFELQRTGDTPLNCFPSLHVGTVILTALQLRTHRKIFGPYLLWALLISGSTLTTKQHYLWDVLGGASLAVLIDWSLRKLKARSEDALPRTAANPVRSIHEEEKGNP
jgi:membrane-associated phospholipid phosphatase